MATVLKLALFIICFINISSCSSETTTSGTLNWWCSQTPHQETCNYYVGRHNNISTTTTTVSATQVLEKIVKAAVDVGLVAHEKSHGIESKYPNAPGKSLWASCVDYIDEIIFTLNMVLDHTRHPTPHDVQTWLSACLAYITSCENGFDLINLTTNNLHAISTPLTQLIVNSLAISALVTGSNTHGFIQYRPSDSAALQNNPTVVVAQDGSGDFRTIQDAVNSASGQTPDNRYVIHVKAGIYNEYVVIPNTVAYITMIGDGINKTIITGNRHAGGNKMRTSNAGDLKQTSTFQVWGSGFIARDITFQNTAGPQAGQAVALLSASDQSAFYRCSFEGYQDTLFTIANTQFYKECQIFGTVDFIFGDAAVVFQDCQIFFRKPSHDGLVVTAHGRKSKDENTGYSLQGCKITAADDLKPVIGSFSKAYLGRPWFQYALTVYMESFLDDLIDPKGWLDSSGFNMTTYYGEYKNYGPGSSTAQRVKWPDYHPITDPNVAQDFTVAKLLSGNSWLPATGVPYTAGFEK